MNLIELASIIEDVGATIKYLRDKNLLKKSFQYCGYKCYEVQEKIHRTTGFLGVDNVRRSFPFVETRFLANLH